MSTQALGWLPALLTPDKFICNTVVLLVWSRPAIIDPTVDSGGQGRKLRRTVVETASCKRHATLASMILSVDTKGEQIELIIT
jgi:hypothetical protein